LSGDTTELIVRKGRVMLEGSHTKVKGGNKVVFTSGTFSVAKAQSADKDRDTLENWSKDRAQTLAKANSRISGRMMTAFASSLSNDWYFGGLGRRSGFWLFNADVGCYTLLPFGYGWSSPYGGYYSRSFFGGSGGYYLGFGGNYGVPFGRNAVGGNSTTGSGSGSVTAGGGGPTINPSSSPSRDAGSPMRSARSPELPSGGDAPGPRPPQ
jgi:hypothetical protein